MFPVFLAIAALAVQFAPVSGGEVYVGARTLYFLDDESGKVTASIDIERWINNITVSQDGKKIYIGASNGVNIVDVKTRTVEGLLTDMPGFTVEIDKAGERIYILTNDRKILPDGTVEAMPSVVLVYDLKDRTHLRTIELNRIVFDIEVVPELDRLYCLDLLDSELKVIQLTSGAHIETIYLGDYGFAFKDTIHGFLSRMIRQPDSKKIYIPQGGDESGILVVETTSNSVRRIPLDHEAKWRGGLISLDGKKLYLNAVRFLSVFDVETEKELAWKPLDVPYQGIAIDDSGTKIYLVNPIYDEGGSLAIFDAKTLEPVYRILVPNASPFTVAVGHK